MATNWRDYGDTTLEDFVKEITRRAPGSPLLAEAEAIYNAARPHTRLLLGMNWIEDRYQTDPSKKFPLSNHNLMNMKTPDGSGWMAFDSYAAGAAGWRERITSPTYKNGIYAKTKILPELIHVYAPSSDNNDEVNYVNTVEFIMAGLPRMSDSPGEPTVPTRPTIVVDAGHRSTDRSGNPAEMALTGFMAAAYVDEARAQGYTAYWYQRDLDKDSDPDETVGDLNTVALGIGRWIASTPGPIVFLSCHYNGANSPLHAIVPDVTGLTTAYAGGAPADDTMANNILDLKLAKQIMQNFKAAGLGSLYNGDGIMPEGKTGVGLQGYRLAVFAATVNGRDRTVRLVIEHGGTSDPAAKQDDFTEKCAKAAIAAVNTVYGITTEKPTKPKLMKRTKPAMPIIPSPTVMPLLNKRYTLKRDVKQYAEAKESESSLASRSVLKKGSTVTFAGIALGTNKSGKPALFMFSTGGTYALASEVL